MNAFEVLQKHYLTKYMSGGTQNSKTIFNGRTPSDTVVHNTEVKRTDPNMDNMEKNVQAKETEEAVETAIDHGFDPDSPEGQKKIREILEGINQKKQDVSRVRSIQNLEKARPRKEPWSLPESMKNRGKKYAQIAALAWKRSGVKDKMMDKADVELEKIDWREVRGSSWRPGDGGKPPGTANYAKFSRIFDALREGKGKKKKKKTEKAIMNMEKSSVSPHLARLLAAAAGWALSGDIAGKVDPHLAQEWERATSRRDKTELQEEMMRQMHRSHKKPQPKLLIIQRKSDDGNFLESDPAFDELRMFYKDHAPIPPRYGLLWDAVKHRWTRPEKVGRTVWEVQGHKRFRGTGAGAHERSRKVGGSGGYGVGSSEAGRRFRSVGDIGRVHPHELKHPGQKGLKAFKKVTQPKRR